MMAEDIRTLKTVDSNEPEIIRMKLLETGWIQKSLYCGDYTFWTRDYQKVGIERKSVSDLMSSLGDRLSRQLFNMTEHYHLNILLVEGSWSMVSGQMLTHRGIEMYSWTMVWNFLRSWQDRGVTLELTTNEGHTIRRVNELYAYYQKESHTGGVTRRTVGDSRIMALACGGIGPKLGEQLLKHFGSLRNIANAGIQDFEAVQNIGAKKAMALWSHFNKDGKEVSNDNTGTGEAS